MVLRLLFAFPVYTILLFYDVLFYHSATSTSILSGNDHLYVYYVSAICQFQVFFKRA